MIKVRGVKDISKDLEALVEASKNAILDRAVDSLKAATPVDTGEARDGWRHDGKKIVNDVDHIEQLNDGSSQQAPSHFIETTLLGQPGIRPSGIIVRPK